MVMVTVMVMVIVIVMVMVMVASFRFDVAAIFCAFSEMFLFNISKYLFERGTFLNLLEELAGGSGGTG